MTTVTPSAWISRTAASTARRALRQTALALMVMGDRPNGIAKALAECEAAHNMSAEMGALAALVQVDCPEREAALDRLNVAYSTLGTPAQLLAELRIGDRHAGRRIRDLVPEGARVLTLVRRGVSSESPDPQQQLATGDVLVLYGPRERLRGLGVEHPVASGVPR